MRRGLAVSGLGLLLLAGCDEGGNAALFKPKARTDAEPAQTTAGGATVERDIEAPEVFEVADKGLWDGRPSLGGVWVAHPDVKEPERVLITNGANSKSVIGALFRRERETPGPILQVSSDAAVELGMLAGAPADLKVVALRREKKSVEPPVETPAEAADKATDAAPAKAVATAAPAAAAPSQAKATAGAIEATPLDPVAGAAAAAIGAAEIAAAARSQSGTGAAPSAAAAPQAASAPSALEKPYIQIGIFSLEQNARAAAAKITGAGMTPKVLPQSSQGKSFWRVIVGPASNASDRAAQLAKIKAAGFADAYPVTN